jgi:hypothetical protein
MSDAVHMAETPSRPTPRAKVWFAPISVEVARCHNCSKADIDKQRNTSGMRHKGMLIGPKRTLFDLVRQAERPMLAARSGRDRLDYSMLIRLPVAPFNSRFRWKLASGSSGRLPTSAAKAARAAGSPASNLWNACR